MVLTLQPDIVNLKNEIIASRDKWDEYAKARTMAKDRKWFSPPGIDVREPKRRDDPFWTHMRRFYLYDPSPTLQTLNAPLLAVFGELDTPEGVKADVRAISKSWIRRDAGTTPLRFTQTDGTTSWRFPLTTQMSMSASNDSHRVSSKRWLTGRQDSFVGVHQ